MGNVLIVGVCAERASQADNIDYKLWLILLQIEVTQKCVELYGLYGLDYCEKRRQHSLVSM